MKLKNWTSRILLKIFTHEHNIKLFWYTNFKQYLWTSIFNLLFEFLKAKLKMKLKNWTSWILPKVSHISTTSNYSGSQSLSSIWQIQFWSRIRWKNTEFPWIPKFLHDLIIKLFWFDLQNNFMIISCKNLGI